MDAMQPTDHNAAPHLNGISLSTTSMLQESAKVEELAAAIRAEVAHRVADVSQPPQDVVVTTPKSAPPDALEVLLRQLLTMAKLLDADGLAPGGKPSMVCFLGVVLL